jgi:Na+-driven multidrug efflux pump
LPKAFFTAIPVPLALRHPGALIGLLRVVIISIVLAILGVLYILANPNDPGMRGFGWFLVIVGSIIAGVFTYLWVRKQMEDGDGTIAKMAGAGPKGVSGGRKRRP